MKQNKGITLIALIITIIVLLILALVTIRAVQGDGIISKAQLAKNNYIDAQNDEAGKIADYESYLNGTAGQWTQEGDTIKTTNKDGTKTEIKVGDTVKYNAKSNGEKTYMPKTKNGAGMSVEENEETDRYDLFTGRYTTEDLTWKVLGLNNSGQIEIISTTTSKKLYLANEEGCIHGKDELDTFCNELYGKGKGATKARSVNVDDINKITGFDPKTYSGYGTEYEYTSGKYIVNGQIVTASSNNKVKLKSDEYSYKGSNKMAETSKEWIMLFQNSKSRERPYWLASPYVKAAARDAKFGMRWVFDGFVGTSNALFGSYGGWGDAISSGVRAVVTLESNVQLTGNSTDGWTIK